MNELLEKLSHDVHESWSKWMRYLFSKCNEVGDGCYEIYKSDVDHWQRQIDTQYKDLSEREKESDRIEARSYLRCIRSEIELSRIITDLENIEGWMESESESVFSYIDDLRYAIEQLKKLYGDS